MTGKLYIDGIDAFDCYGVFVVENGYTTLLSWPALKKVESIEWPDEDGIDADLSAPVLDSREFTVNFGTVDTERAAAMIELLSDKAYHSFDFREIGKVFRLRLVSQPKKNVFYRLEKFDLQLADDFPLTDYTYSAPVSDGSVSQRGYEIDGRDLSEYGVWVLEGSDNEILKCPAVKKNLVQNIGILAGAIYDGETVVYQSKEVALKCLIRGNAVMFWHNYNALLHDLTRPGERSLYMESTGEEYPCYYKSAAVSKCNVIRGHIWCEFSVTLVFTSFRVSGTEYLLATESGSILTTEDGEYQIDMDYGN